MEIINYICPDPQFNCTAFMPLPDNKKVRLLKEIGYMCKDKKTQSKRRLNQ